MVNVRGLPYVIPDNMSPTGEESDEQTRACRKDSCCPLKKEIGMRRIFVFLFSAMVALLLASGAVVALPSEKPDETPMIDGRVRAIE
jgi:hypothetical protein